MLISCFALLVLFQCGRMGLIGKAVMLGESENGGYGVNRE